MVKNAIQQKEFDKFKDVLFNEKIIRQKMERIQSKKHKLGTYEIGKISLSWFDPKKYVLDDGSRTLPYFHKNSVTSCKEIKKIVIKKNVIIEKKNVNWKNSYDWKKKKCYNLKKLW